MSCPENLEPEVVAELPPRSGASTSAWIPNAGALATFRILNQGSKYGP